jgi:hypothetical protein
MKAQEETRSRLFAAPLAGRVLLRNVTAAAEGVYKCEVSTEAPYFDTDYEEANLSVVGKSIIQISDLNFPARI